MLRMMMIMNVMGTLLFPKPRRHASDAKRTIVRWSTFLSATGTSVHLSIVDFVPHNFTA